MRSDQRRSTASTIRLTWLKNKIALSSSIKEAMDGNNNRTDFFRYLLENDFGAVDDEIMLLLFAAATGDDHPRPSFYVRDRLEWDTHVAKLFNEGPHSFSQLYCMEYGSFVKLCSLLDPDNKGGSMNVTNTHWESTYNHGNCASLLIEMAWRWLIP